VIDGDLVKIVLEGDRVVSIMVTDDRAEATHVVADSWSHKGLSDFGVTFESVEYHLWAEGASK